MRRRVVWYGLAWATLVAVVLLPLVRPGNVSVHGDARSTSPRSEDIDRWVAEEMARSRTRGAAVVVVEHGQVVYLRGFGGAGRAAITPTTRFRLGSVSKSFNALAVMQLVEVGRLDLDSPVARYLPWFRTADAGASTRMTLRHLLTHTSGIPRRVGLGSLEGGDRPTLEERVKSLNEVELRREPGSGFEYANINFEILGLIVEAVTGRAYADHVADVVFRPLAMGSTTLLPAEPAQGHHRWLGFPVPGRLPYLAAAVPSGMVTTTAEDLGRYLVAMLNGGGGVVSHRGLAELQRPAVAAPGGAYGKGWMVGRFGREQVVWHRGNALVHSATVVLSPGRERGLAVLANDATPLTLSSDRIAGGVIRLLREDVPPAPGRGAARSFLLYDTALLAYAVGVLEGVRGAFAEKRHLLSTLVLNIVIALAVAWWVLETLGSLTLAWRQVPDVALVLLGGSALLLASGMGSLAVGLRRGWQARRGNRTAHVRVE